MSYKEYQSPSFLEAYKNAFVSCLDFEGRSRRAEYWKYILVYYFFIIVTFAICFVINTIISDADSICKGILIVFFLAHILPNLSICARRLWTFCKMANCIVYPLHWCSLRFVGIFLSV